ncbi:hypothetical protein AMTR_s00122p00136570 [Amborella trichopoda]|uniref:Uncharacterized protein n=1 Tax=Amborella trichopoda TaxID=13333 RepID=W1NPS8_AMBTC|nr:hypothetical protein AMTR_s00122p00136570 [Amborella trichopoda]
MLSVEGLETPSVFRLCFRKAPCDEGQLIRHQSCLFISLNNKKSRLPSTLNTPTDDFVPSGYIFFPHHAEKSKQYISLFNSPPRHLHIKQSIPYKVAGFLKRNPQIVPLTYENGYLLHTVMPQFLKVVGKRIRPRIWPWT